MKIANDGHTARVRLANSSQLKLGKETWTLHQFHFHTPGGDRLAGEEFPMAAHLLHKSRSGQLLALVVLFRLGAENPALKALLPHIPASADGDHLIADSMADPGALLPARKAYYHLRPLSPLQHSTWPPPCRPFGAFPPEPRTLNPFPHFPSSLFKNVIYLNPYQKNSYFNYYKNQYHIL